MASKTKEATVLAGISVEGKLAEKDAEIRNLRRRVAEIVDQQTKNAKYEAFISSTASVPLSIPSWLSPSNSSAKKLVVPTAFLSDEHFDEVVDPAQVNGVNAYNRKIAEKRLRMFFTSAVKLAKHYFSGLNYPGIVLALGGDNVSGNIHEELRNTNEAFIADTLLHYAPMVAAGIKMLAEEFGKVYVPCVVGNHGRLTHKPIHKGRVRDNFDWLFYHIIARELSSDKRITFGISDSADITYSVFDTTFCLTHGDQFKGGSGIAGALSPLMLGDARKRKRSMAINHPYHYLMMGHWHQFMSAKNLIVNGSLKGYDEYAFHLNFDYEPPQQAFFLTSAERKTIWGLTPINVTDANDPYSGVNREQTNHHAQRAF